MRYESPELFELGNAEDVTLGCGCDHCDCGEGKHNHEPPVLD